MDKLLITVITLFATVSLMASDVSVYKVVGVVKMKKQDLWEDIEKQFNLKDTDIIQIGENSSLSLVDKSNSRIYTYEAEGEWRVSEIIRKCRTTSKNMTIRLLQEIQKDVKSSKQKTYISLGGVKRDVMDEDLLENVYTQLCKLVSTEKQCQSSLVILKQMDNKDGTSFFVIENKSKETMFANVLYRPTTNSTWAVLYECSAETPCLEIPANSSLEMKHITVVVNEGEYVLFALRNPIDSGELDYMFGEELEPKEIETDYPIEVFMLNR